VGGLAEPYYWSVRAVEFRASESERKDWVVRENLEDECVDMEGRRQARGGMMRQDSVEPRHHVGELRGWERELGRVRGHNAEWGEGEMIDGRNSERRLNCAGDGMEQNGPRPGSVAGDCRKGSKDAFLVLWGTADGDGHGNGT